MKTIKTYISVIVGMIGLVGWAQQDGVVTQYNDLMNIYNPAYSGMNEEGNFTTAYVKQWAGAAQSPTSMFIAYDKKLSSGLGVGLNILNDKTFVETNNVVSLDLSYGIQLTNGSSLYFGLRGSGVFYNLNASGLTLIDSAIDPSLVDISVSKPNLGFGFHLINEKWDMSISIPKFFETTRIAEENGVNLLSTSKMHVYSSFGYKIRMNDQFTVRPSVLMTYVDGIDPLLDINTMVSYNNILECGLTLRSNKGISALSTFKLNEKLKIGFAYGMGARGSVASVNNNLEFLLRTGF